MARSLTSALAASLFAVLAYGQDFGRFGYRSDWDLPDLKVDSSGIRSRFETADVLKFPRKMPSWHIVATSQHSQTVFSRASSPMPERLRANLWGFGVALLYSEGFQFNLATTQSPYLTWSEGSVGDGVPTPKSKWIAISFRDNQPPLLMSFEGGEASATISGSAGKWSITSSPDFKGWVRVLAPTGSQPFRTNSAGELGELALRCKKLAPYLEGPAATLLSTAIADDTQGVNVTWTFDRPFAVAPPALTLAPLGGYALRTFPELLKTDVSGEEGPISVAQSKSLTVRLPIRRIPTGRAAMLGASVSEVQATVSYLDIGGVTELAWLSLLGSRERSQAQLAQETLDAFLEDSSYELEPYTGQKLPFAPDGSGADIAAGHALLMQAILSAQKPESGANGLLTSVAWRRDSWTMRFWCDDRKIARRVGSLAAIAGALCVEPERRYEAALFEAGLAAEQGLNVWRQRRQLAALELGAPAPFAGVRQRLFGVPGAKSPETEWVEAIMSPLRVYGALGATFTQEGQAQWVSGISDDGKPFQLSFSSATEVKLEAGSNVKELKSSQAFGTTLAFVTPNDIGPWRIKLTRPVWAPPLPAAIASPRFTP